MKLLVVDDQPANIQALYRVFADDHQVLMATSGEQALALCASKQPDLVLLDVVMPGMDGYEVCRRLKSDDATRDTPVIFVTAQELTALAQMFRDGGQVVFNDISGQFYFVSERRDIVAFLRSLSVEPEAALVDPAVHHCR